jgi:hypothetical protein
VEEVKISKTMSHFRVVNGKQAIEVESSKKLILRKTHLKLLKEFSLQAQGLKRIETLSRKISDF